MRNLVTSLLLLSVVPTGCGSDIEVLEENIEHQIRWQQAPGEIQDCHVFKLSNQRSVEIDRLQIKFPEGSHHVHLYRATDPEEDKVYDCFNGIDWARWSLVIGAQTKPMDWQLPEGVTLELAPHQQLLAQVHWLNTTDRPIESQIDLSFHTTPESQEHLGVVFGVNKRINVGPLEHSRVEAFCPMPAGAKLHALMGHFHMHGSDYRVIERMPNQATGLELYAAPDEPAFEFKTFAPAHEVPQGAGFQYECNFFNPSGMPLTWGSDTQTQEHCNMSAYFSPADKMNDLCLTQPSKLTSLTARSPAVRAGQDLTFDVALAAAEPDDLVVALQSSDMTSLEVPASVTVRAGQLNATFVARARRPGNYEVTASVSGARVITPVRVTGIVISEVFYNPASGLPDNVQWIEIANQTNMELDLTPYSIGAGTTDYLNTRLALPMTIRPRDCIVVGGPVSSSVNHSPVFALSANLEPDLGQGIGSAAGIGLFTTSGMSSKSRPVDAVVYGGTNMSLLGPDGQLAPVWTGAPAGGSLKRMAENSWVSYSAPTPGVCEILYAP